MSSLSFAKAFGREKPHSSTTDWIEILTADSIVEESYDGPAEAIRALRKKLKHGSVHQQYRALVLLKALVENCGPRFAAAVSDSQFMDVLRSLLSSSTTDKRVKRKLKLILESWREQYQTDPSMSSLVGLYKQAHSSRKAEEIAIFIGQDQNQREKRDREAHKAKEEEAKRKAAEQSRVNRERTRRAPFDFQKEKPKILNSIVDASQASSNLSNAIRLVNPETDTVETNAHVQDCLEKAKQARKIIVRYIQLVENEELIGTLIETNDRINSSIDIYEQLLAAHDEDLIMARSLLMMITAHQMDRQRKQIMCTLTSKT
ncbi:hypothetical protein AX16_000357 [Volvariella volvacea WC 439]|nr:hypothetical protein AX16_000357 [Volvariella volvacea WC 439]